MWKKIRDELQSMVPGIMPAAVGLAGLAVVMAVFWIEGHAMYYSGQWVLLQTDQMVAREEAEVVRLRSETPCVDALLRSYPGSGQTLRVCPHPEQRLLAMGEEYHLCRCGGAEPAPAAGAPESEAPESEAP